MQFLFCLIHLSLMIIIRSSGIKTCIDLWVLVVKNFMFQENTITLNCVRSKGERREGWTPTLWPEDKSVPLAVWGAQQVWLHVWTVLKVCTVYAVSTTKSRGTGVCEVRESDCLVVDSEISVSLTLKHIVGHDPESVLFSSHPHNLFP
jgi:hypothetical protein